MEGNILPKVIYGFELARWDPSVWVFIEDIKNGDEEPLTDVLIDLNCIEWWPFLVHLAICNLNFVFLVPVSSIKIDK